MTDTPHIIRRGALDIIQVDNASCSAEVALFGGHVLHWQPSGHKPVLWMSDTANYDGKTALRGGIPICWPWFGPIEGKGRHGLARDRVWQLDQYKEDNGTTALTLSLTLSNHDNPWPHPNRIVMSLTFGRTLEQTLAIHNDSEAPLCFAYAFHNYFHVSDPRNIKIPSITNAIYTDQITGDQHLIDSGDKPYVGPIDRIYHNDRHTTLTDTQLERSITIEKSHSQHWVLWNPGPEARNTADIHPGGEHEFLCFEAASTTDIMLAPNEHIVLSQTLSVQ
ncbi:D-hexose-6-phosphate mutarotase [Teredinibacter purpureus]|jgi:Uncharacterized enzymes related to aldose 1-epimerase|uniref:D-hexose-6-phosphate mutarotase n=1 Tax=Teredinibacter purpureus TaxID=2731756 RepID=UPI0005F879AE|nr:D-hexose-6-phosphate mutarotase [Teredinibacter purpureus]